MVSDVPQIDLSSLSRQQLQHLLETSRRAGRTEMADAVAHEMRERRTAHPEAPRSWVEVDFSELASEPDLELAPELQVEPTSEPEPESPVVVDAPEDLSPRREVAAAGPADPYAFSAIRSVPDGSLRVSAPTPRRPEPRTRAPLPRTGARVARPRAGLVLGAVALGAAAVAAVAAIVPLQQLQIPRAAAPTPPVVQAALAPPPATPEPEAPAGPPPPRAAVALTLRGPITSPADPTAAAAPASPPRPGPTPVPTREFTIAAADLKAAADEANQRDMAKAHAEGLEGTWINPDFAPARCRWSRTDATLAVCQTRTRYEASRPWRERTGHYRRDGDGKWQVAP